MNPTTVAAVSVAGAFLLMLGGLAIAKSVVRPKVTTNVTITRVNGQKVTTEVGRVIAWSLKDGRMTLEFEPDLICQHGFECDEAR
jgi:hypothetical protein